MKRRSFLQTAAITTTAMVAPSVLSATIPAQKAESSIELEKGNVILFQGDSITDAGREKTRELPNSGGSFGGGYAFLAASALLNRYASLELQIYNRGISGNKVYQLSERWKKDCLDLKPNILSILIGVNDYWHMRNGHYDGTVEVYKNDFLKLIRETKAEFPGIKLVICQPFILPDTTAVDQSWVAPFAEYQKAAFQVSQESGAIWVPFQEVFNEALKHAPATWWAPDGVHPSMAGSWLMAAAWLKAVTGTDI